MTNDLTLIQRQLDTVAPRLTEVLAGRMPVGQLIQTILFSFERTPKLFDCKPQSVLNAAMTFAVLGLPVDGVTGQGYMIPYKGQAQPVIGYKGYNTLAARAGMTVTAGTVHKGDDFDYERGTTPFVKHKSRPLAPPDITHFWAVATSNERPPVIEVLTLDEILAVKKLSPGGSSGPWMDHFAAMGEKTARRRLARSMPLALNHPEFHLAARLDEAFDEQGKGGFLLPGNRIILEGEAGEKPAIETLDLAQEEQSEFDRLTTIETMLRTAAKGGTKELFNTWQTLSPKDKRIFEALKDRHLKPTALEADRGSTDAAAETQVPEV